MFVDEVLDCAQAVPDYCWGRVGYACQAALLLVDGYCLEMPELCRVISHANQIQERRYGRSFEGHVLAKDAAYLRGQFLVAVLNGPGQRVAATAMPLGVGQDGGGGQSDAVGLTIALRVVKGTRSRP